MPAVSSKVVRKEVETLDLVRFRDVLAELLAKGQRDPLLDLVLALLGQCKALIEDQALEIASLRKQLFGRKSEKTAPLGQDDLFPELLAAVVAHAALDTDTPPDIAPAADEDDEAASSGGGDGVPPKNRRRGKRKPLSPHRSEEIRVPDEERPCPECGSDRRCIGHTRSIVVEYVPPKIEIIEYQREKLACRPCEGAVQSAPVPEERVVDGARPGPQLLATLAINKVVDGLPLHRTRRIFGRLGVDLPIQTLNRWEAFGHEVVSPVIRALVRAVKESDVIQLDDTGLRVRDRNHVDGVRNGHMWVFVGRKFDPEGDLRKTLLSVAYLYAPTWEAKYPKEFLKDSRAILQGDAYRGYQTIATGDDGVQKNTLVGCMMHSRRPFFNSMEAGDPAALYFIERFQKIYLVEAEAKERALTAPQRLDLRQTKSLKIMDELHQRLKELEPLPLLKPMRTGVRYMLNQWEKLLIPFRDDGRLEIDNGESERRLRRVASGRKSWLFAGSEHGAERFAGMLSLVASAEAADLEPGRYLADLFGELPRKRRADAGMDQFLPHHWARRDKAAK